MGVGGTESGSFVPCQSLSRVLGPVVGRGSGSSPWWLPERIASLPKMTDWQKAVFGLGDALKVVTLTANGSAVRGAGQLGVGLACYIHRPVWLTGR